MRIDGLQTGSWQSIFAFYWTKLPSSKYNRPGHNNAGCKWAGRFLKQYFPEGQNVRYHNLHVDTAPVQEGISDIHDSKEK